MATHRRVRNRRAFHRNEDTEMSERKYAPNASAVVIRLADKNVAFVRKQAAKHGAPLTGVVNSIIEQAKKAKKAKKARKGKATGT